MNPNDLKDWQEAIAAATSARMRFIEANKTKLIEAFLAETGLKPSECVLCHQTMLDGEFRFWVRKMESIDDTLPNIED